MKPAPKKVSKVKISNDLFVFLFSSTYCALLILIMSVVQGGNTLDGGQILFTRLLVVVRYAVWLFYKMLYNFNGVGEFLISHMSVM